MKSSRVRTLLVVSVLTCALAACGGKDDSADDLPTLTPQPSTPASSTPPPATPTPKPTAEPTQAITKYGQLTLVFNQPATVDAKARQAVKTYRVFQQIFRGMLGTSTDDPQLKAVAAPNVVKYVQGVLQNQVKDGDKLGGTLTITTKIQQVEKSVVLLGGCFDQSKSYGIHPGGAHYIDPVIKEQPKLNVVALAAPLGGGWQITEYRLEAGPC
jgi:hypothetical protein